MKKVLVLVFVSLLCFGCRKKNDITINVYKNRDSEKVIIEKKTNDYIEESHDEELSPSSSDTTLKDKAKDKYETAKEWYEENKDELKEINEDIIQNDIDTITNAARNAKEWYDENKEDLKQSAKNEYNNGKEKLKSVFKN